MSMSHFMMELRSLRGGRRLPFPRKLGGTWTRGTGNARCRRCKSDRRATRRTSRWRRRRRRWPFLLEVEGDVAELLLDVADDLALGGGHHGVASLGHDLHEVVGQVASGQVETQDGVGKGVTLIDDETGGTTGGVQGKDGLDAHVRGG